MSDVTRHVMSVNSPVFKTVGFAKQLLTRASRTSRLSILIYHRVLVKPDTFYTEIPDVNAFSWQMELLHRHYNVIPLSQAIEQLKTNRLQPETACVTFDDGYADNYLHALPVLQQWNIPATFFVASGFLDGGMMWNDIVLEGIRHHRDDHLDLTPVGLQRYELSDLAQRRQLAAQVLPVIKYLSSTQREEVTSFIKEQTRQYLPENLMMTTEQLKALHASGMEIGGHTVHHPILSSLSAQQAEQEIDEGRQQLSSKLDGSIIRYFAYPNGKPGQDYNADHAEFVKRIGFEGAVSTSYGAATSNSDLYQLPRFTPWDKTPLKFSMRLMKNALLPYQ